MELVGQLSELLVPSGEAEKITINTQLRRIGFYSFHVGMQVHSPKPLNFAMT
jgi:hypothetical protein